jgi:hypothetical protein
LMDPDRGDKGQDAEAQAEGGQTGPDLTILMDETDRDT